jgi:hypothetical protein
MGNPCRPGCDCDASSFVFGELYHRADTLRPTNRRSHVLHAVFGGVSTDGQVRNFGHLSFDQYDQDQVVSLEQTETSGRRTAGLSINDQPGAPLDFAAWSRLESMPEGAARSAEIERLKRTGGEPRQQLFLGKTAEKTSEIDLKDAKGRVRLKLKVMASGEASIQFLDANGRVSRQLGGVDR